MYLTLFSKLFKHTPQDHHAWACLTRCTTISHLRHNHNNSSSKNRKLLVRGVNVPREFTKQDMAKIFEENEAGVTVVSEDDMMLVNKKKYFRYCYLHGLHVGEFERAQRLLADHNMKLYPVLNTTMNPEHQKVMYVFAKAVNLPPGSSEQDIFQLFKGWVHEENHVYPLYSDSDENKGELLTECYAAMPFDTYTEAKPALKENHDIQLSVHSNTVHARSAIRDMERMSTEKHMLVLRNMPDDVTVEKLSVFLDVELTLMRRFEDYLFVPFGKEEDIILAFQNGDWMREFGEDVQLKYKNKMRKFRVNEPFRFDFWRHRERTLSEL